MSNIEFVERHTLGDGWIVEVRRSKELIGHIRRHADGSMFQYFPGRANELNPTFRASSLENIKERVLRDPTGQALGN